jgi:Iron-containing redox enzyme
MNLREATTNNTRRLASILSRVEDERIRCILAKQLNDELGNGNIKHIHRKSFEQMMTVLEHWKMESFTEDMVISGKEFSQQLENIYVNSNPYVSVGSTILMEVYGKQFYLWLGQELRKTNVDLSRIPWVTLHEELEVDHANESLILAGFVTDSKEGVIAARQGIEKSSMASWKFLDSLYCLCYG